MASRAAGAGTVPVSGKTLLILLRREIRFGLSRLIRAWPTRNAAIRPRLTGYGSSRGSALRSCERRSALAPRQTAGSLFHCSVSPPRRGSRRSSQATATLAKRPAAYRGNRSRRIYRGVDGARTTAGPASALTTGCRSLARRALTCALRPEGSAGDQGCGTVLCAIHLYRSAANAFGSRVRM